MKATGMIRKIDDLGRIVIPKEIRKTLKIREGDSLEIYTNAEGEVILKRYAPLGDLLENIESLAESISNNTDSNICVTDTKQILVATGSLVDKYLYKEISKELLEKLDERMLWQNKGENHLKLIEGEEINRSSNQLIVPIIYEGSVLGSVILVTYDMKRQITDVEIKMIKVMTDYLANRM
ncbi:MAG: AbrB/MazE/SpoVT family DNA-binding domain-containing protein [Clostridia bacterium]|nr:AbrB/MazE/SpoVT family DNA-binding domain-containing protein [Clostridia bacterium]